MIEDPKRPGKLKKVKKQIPAYIPEHDAMVLASVRKTAYRLDMCLFNFLGIRFGWEAVIGIIPAFGDVVGVMMALMLWRKCQKVEGGLDSATSMRMLVNIALDFVVGLVPFIGDLADAAFKANTRNCRLLERHLEQKHRPGGRDERNFAGVDREKRRQNRKSGIYAPHDPPPATAFDDFSDEEEDRRQFMREQDAERRRVQEPRATRAPEDRRGGQGLFGGGRKESRRERPAEVNEIEVPRRYDSRSQRQETGSVRR